MNRRNIVRWIVAIVASSAWGAVALGNGGPFVVKYPEGDPAAKGVLARIGPDLKPGRIHDLRVIKEDLHVDFTRSAASPLSLRPPDARGTSIPLVQATAAYEIENPTDRPITVDFGFPVLRGIYISPFAMMPVPDASVTLDTKALPSRVISNSSIYGLIRRQARQVIERGVDGDAALRQRVASLRSARDQDRPAAQRLVENHLVGVLKWQRRDAALFAEYAAINFDTPALRVFGAGLDYRDPELSKLAYSDLGILSSIGEQKATQLLAHLAGKFDAEAAAGYEAIFAAWGGEVRERAIDLRTGTLRPREVRATDAQALSPDQDPTVYARVRYLDDNARLTPAQRASLENILKNLPVVFTFAPMNLIYYQATFPPHSRLVLAVRYTQYAYLDTAEPASFQFAYVVHPASMWDDFGPIHLTVTAPAGASVKASVPLQPAKPTPPTGAVKREVYNATFVEKTGELFIAIDQAGWNRAADALPRRSPPSLPE